MAAHAMLRRISQNDEVTIVLQVYLSAGCCDKMVAQVEKLSEEVATSVTTGEREKSDAALNECFQRHSREKALKNYRIGEYS